MIPIILASTSPYRKAVLEKLGIPFNVASPDVDEQQLPNETPEQLVKRLAQAKAMTVAKDLQEGLVIGSDQVAVNKGKILGKPGTHEKAAQQLTQASGQRITFYTGLCLINAATKNTQTDVMSFHVHFRTLSATQIENYLQKEQPYDSAGSFKSEGLGIALFERLEGDDPNTLIGLPLIQLVSMLEHEGVRVI